MTEAMVPQTQILATITAEGGSLARFSWNLGEKLFRFMDTQRPRSFWDALLAHALTLQILDIALDLDGLLKSPAPENSTRYHNSGQSKRPLETKEQMNFPVLTSLVLYAGHAHPAVVNKLLSVAPSLQILDLAWYDDGEFWTNTGYDWNWHFPKLNSMELFSQEDQKDWNQFAEFLNLHERVKHKEIHLGPMDDWYCPTSSSRWRRVGGVCDVVHKIREGRYGGHIYDRLWDSDEDSGEESDE